MNLGVCLQGTEEDFLDVFLTLVAFPTFRLKRFSLNHIIQLSTVDDTLPAQSNKLYAVFIW